MNQTEKQLGIFQSQWAFVLSFSVTACTFIMERSVWEWIRCFLLKWVLICLPGDMLECDGKCSVQAEGCIIQSGFTTGKNICLCLYFCNEGEIPFGMYVDRTKVWERERFDRKSAKVWERGRARARKKEEESELCKQGLETRHPPYPSQCNIGRECV